MKRLSNQRVTRLGGAQTIYCLSLNTGKLEFTETFSLEKLVNHLLVRGTILFYNQKLQLMPVGKSVMWNVVIHLSGTSPSEC